MMMMSNSSSNPHPPSLLPPGPVLAVDYGEKRVGLAVTDAERLLARGLETVVLDKKKPDAVTPVLQRVQQYQPVVVVIGLPVNMDGSEGFMAEAVYAFAEALADALAEAGLDTPIELMDERLTSRLAENNLRARGLEPSRQKHLIDQEAARLLLEDYLRSLG